MKPIVPASAALGTERLSSGLPRRAGMDAGWACGLEVAPASSGPGGTGSPDGPRRLSGNSSSVLSHQVLPLAVRLFLQMAAGGLW